MGVFIYEFREALQVCHLFKSKMIDNLNLVLLEPLPKEWEVEKTANKGQYSESN